MACEDRAEGPSDIHRSWLPSYGSTWTHGSWLLGSGVLGCADRWCTPIPTVYHWVNSGHVKWQIQALHLHTSHMGQAALPRCLAPSTFCRDVDIYIYIFFTMYTWQPGEQKWATRSREARGSWELMVQLVKPLTAPVSELTHLPR